MKNALSLLLTLSLFECVAFQAQGANGLAPQPEPGSLDASFDPGQGADAPINTVVAQDDGKILIAGQFTSFNSVERRYIARLNPDGSLDADFDPGFGLGANLQFGGSPITSLAVQKDGKILIGGSFTNLNGTLRTNVARLNRDGSLDEAFAFPASSLTGVRSVALQEDGKILLGGNFSDPGYGRVVRLNADGTLDQSFRSSDAVQGFRSMALQRDGKVLVNELGSIHRLNVDGTLDATFAWPVEEYSTSAHAIALQDDLGLLVTGWLFGTNGFRRLKLDASLDPTFTPAISYAQYEGLIQSIAVQSDRKILVGGQFTLVDGSLRRGIARLNADGRLDTGFHPGTGLNGPNPNAPPDVTEIALQSDGKIIVVGGFRSVDGQQRNGIARLHGGEKAPGPPTIITQPLSQTVRAGQAVSVSVSASSSSKIFYQWFFNDAPIAFATNETLEVLNAQVNDSGVYTVSASNAFGSVISSKTSLVVLPPRDDPGGIDLSFSPVIPEGGEFQIKTMLRASDDKILIGGSFNSVYGTPRDGLARLNADGTLDSNFEPSSSRDIQAISIQNDGKILIGGTFTRLAGKEINYVARLAPDGALDPDFNPPSISSEYLGVLALGLQEDRKILIGGRIYVSTPGPSLSGLARLNGDGSLDTTFNQGTGLRSFGFESVPSISSIAFQSDGKILIAGYFSSYNDTPRSAIARLNPDGSLDLSFQPPFSPGDGVNSLRFQSDGKILLAGYFQQTASNPGGSLIRVNADGSLDRGFDTGGYRASIQAIALDPNGKILVGGYFSMLGKTPRSGIARLHENGALDFGFDPGAGVDPYGAVNSILVESTGKIVVGGTFRSYDGIPRSAIARVNGGDAPAKAPVISLQPADQTITAGQETSFIVSATSFSIPTLQWQFNGANFPGGTNAILSLRNVRAVDAGNYTVVVSNSLGSVTSAAAKLTVIPLPSTPGATDVDFYAGSGPNGIIDAMAQQPDGKILIGGEFTMVDGSVRNRLARLNPDGSLDGTFDSGLGPSDSLRPAQSPQPFMPRNPLVRTIVAQSDGKVIVGGDFLRVAGLRRRFIARLNPDGAVDESFTAQIPPTDEAVGIRSIALQEDGKLIVGGRFFLGTDGAPRFIARLTSDGNLDTSFFSAHETGLVVTLQPDGKILTLSSSGLVRLNSDGSADGTFSTVSLTALFLRYISTIALHANGQVVVGTSGLMARVFSDGSIDPSFDPEGLLNATYLTEVAPLVIQPDGKVLLGGGFGIGRLNCHGTQDTSFNTILAPQQNPADGYPPFVNSILLLSNGKIIIGGDFSQVNGTPRNNIARLFGGDLPAEAPRIRAQPLSQTVKEGQTLALSATVESTSCPAYQWELNGTNLVGANGRSIVLQDVRLANAGDYQLVIQNNLGSVTSRTATVTVIPARIQPGSLDLDFHAPVHSESWGSVQTILSQTDGKIIVGGTFQFIHGLQRHGIVRLNRDGTVDPSFNPGGPASVGFSPAITALALQGDGKLIVGGLFSSFNGVSQSGITRLLPHGSLDSSFDPGVGIGDHSSNPFIYVYATALQADGKILIGGNFTSVNNVSQSHLARLNTDGQLDTSFNLALSIADQSGETENAFVKTLAVLEDGKIIVGGVFARVAGEPRNGIARLTRDGFLDPAFDPGPVISGEGFAEVDTVWVRTDGKLLIGGSFSKVGDAPRNNLAQLNSDGTVDLNFASTIGPDGAVRAIVEQEDGKIIIGGRFTQFNGVIRKHIARLNPDGYLDLAFDPGLGIDDDGEPTVNALALQSNDTVLVGGQFSSIDGIPRDMIAPLRTVNAIEPLLLNYFYREGSFQILVRTVAGRQYYLEYKDSLTGANWLPAPGITGDGTTQTMVDPGAAVRERYYRVRVD